MKIDEIKTIVKLMSENDLTEFKIEAEEYNLCIKRGNGAIAVQMPLSASPAPAAISVPAQAPAAPVPAPAAAPAPAATPAVTIDSPIVGTFYRASAPDAAPFVKVGDRVSTDTVVGIIEAMKVLNEIKADKNGVIKDILVENGQPVEFGQPLIVIE